MGRIFRILGIGSLAVLVIFLVLGAALVLYNLEDDQLDPNVARLLAETPPQISAEENGYFAWIGIAGPVSIPPHEWGRRWFEEALAADRDRSTPPLAIEAEIKPDSPQLPGIPCSKVENCLNEVAENPAAVRKALNQTKVLLQRCNAAMAYKRYQEPWRPHFSLWSQFSHHPTACRNLQAAHFALTVVEAGDEEALEYLETMVAFHILQMQGAYTLLDKVLAISHLRRDYLLLNQYLLQRPGTTNRHFERLNRILTPLDTRASNMAIAMKTESLVTARLILDLPDMASLADEDARELPGSQVGTIEKFLTKLFLLPNATVNEHFKQYDSLAKLDQQSGESYRKALNNADNTQEGDEEGGLFGYLAIRNPIGHILNQIGRPAFTSYFRTRDDLLALRAAVAFQLELVSRGVEQEEAIARAVSTARLIHRASGKAATWDKATRTLSFPRISKGGREPPAIKL